MAWLDKRPALTFSVATGLAGVGVAETGLAGTGIGATGFNESSLKPFADKVCCKLSQTGAGWDAPGKLAHKFCESFAAVTEGGAGGVAGKAAT
jgi:hypothetical protein